MVFIYKGNMDPNAGRQYQYKTIADTQTLTVGEAVKLSSGKLVTWGTGGAGYGILTGFTKADKSPLTDDGAGGLFSGTYLTPGSNTVLGIVDISKESVYSVALDATVGTTNDSDFAGVNVDCGTTSVDLDETSTEVVGTPASFHSHGQDPDGSAASNSLLVSIQESQVWI